MAFCRPNFLLGIVLTFLFLSVGSAWNLPFLSSSQSQNNGFFAKFQLNKKVSSAVQLGQESDDSYIPFAARQVEPSSVPSTPTATASAGSGGGTGGPGTGGTPTATASAGSGGGTGGPGTGGGTPSPSISTTPNVGGPGSGGGTPSPSVSSSLTPGGGGGGNGTPSPSITPTASPGGGSGSAFCTRRVLFPNNVLRRIKMEKFRRTYAFKKNLVKFRYKFTPLNATGFRVRLRALGNRRIARVQINFFYPSIRLKHKQKLGTILRFDFTNPANKGYKREFDLVNYQVPPGRENCCDTTGNVGFYIKTCNPSSKKRVRCAFKLMSIRVPVKCVRA